MQVEGAVEFMGGIRTRDLRLQGRRPSSGRPCMLSSVRARPSLFRISVKLKGNRVAHYEGKRRASWKGFLGMVGAGLTPKVGALM